MSKNLELKLSCPEQEIIDSVRDLLIEHKGLNQSFAQKIAKQVLNKSLEKGNQELLKAYSQYLLLKAQPDLDEYNMVI